MAKKITRRQFLKLSGQAVVATGAACALTGLPGGVQPAEAAPVPVALDGRELVGCVGDTFATIQVVPRYTKTKNPVGVYGKVQYGTDPTFTTYLETPEVAAQFYCRSEGGRHKGADGLQLIAAHRINFISGRWGIVPGDVIYNETDGSVMTVTSVVNEHTIAGTLAGGTKNLWKDGDKWRLDRTYYRLAVQITGLQEDTLYHYRLLLRYDGDDYSARDIHSFRTRRPAGETFQFGIWADTHRDVRAKALSKQLWHWPEWSVLVQSMKAEPIDFLMDLGDSWLMCKGSGHVATKDFPEAYSRIAPSRSGYQTYKGYSDLCADCGYYLSRGNHDGLTDADPPEWKQLFIPLLKMFVPNPNGRTYPQGGSTDSDYDQGYFAFEWGDALFIVLDAIKYKDYKKKIPNPSRFHIGAKQLAWVTNTLQNATQRWKFMFFHHLFGGGDNYGRGGAVFAKEYEQAQLHALAVQYGAHFFHGHDHLWAEEMVDGVLYYESGLAWGSQSDYITKGAHDKPYSEFYPEGFTSTSCHSIPPGCENNGYVIVEVSPTQVTIWYKNYHGQTIKTTTLT
jgi:hypothetical protein